MNSRISLLFSFLLLAAFSLPAQKTFEGTVNFSTSQRQDISILFTIRGDQCLMQPQGQRVNKGLVILTDKATGDYWIVNEQFGEKSVMKYRLQGELSNARRDPATSSPSGNSEVIKTGETREISGYPCVRYTVNSAGEDYNLWIAEELGYLDLGSCLTPQSGVDESYLRLADIKGFPLEIDYFDTETNEVVTVVFAVEEKKIDGSLMDVVGDAQVVDMDEINRLIREANGDPDELKRIRQMLTGEEDNQE